MIETDSLSNYETRDTMNGRRISTETLRGVDENQGQIQRQKTFQHPSARAAMVSWKQ